MRSGQAIADLLHSMGATHVVWETATSHGQDSMLGDVRFFEFATNWTDRPVNVGTFTLARIAPRRGDRGSTQYLAFIDCSDGVANGLYPLGDLSALTSGDHARPVPRPIRPFDDPTGPILQQADVIVVNRSCQPVPARDATSWSVFRRGPYEIAVRVALRGQGSDAPVQ
jgi:hypothetical protein